MSAFIRRLSKSKVGAVIMVLFVVAIAASFALADVQSYISTGFGNTGALVEVGKEGVTERDLSTAMQRRLTEVRQQNPEADYSSLGGDFAAILNSLIQNRAMQVFARNHDLHISKRLVDAEIAALPAARGLDGRFSEAAYANFLQQQRLSDAQVRDVLGGSLASRMLLAPAAANARIPVGVATHYASMMLEARDRMRRTLRLPSSTISSKARANRKSPTSTLAGLPQMMLAVRRPRRSSTRKKTSSAMCSRIPAPSDTCPIEHRSARRRSCRSPTTRAAHDADLSHAALVDADDRRARVGAGDLGRGHRRRCVRPQVDRRRAVADL